MNLLWLCLALLPATLYAACNSVLANGRTYATGICFFNAQTKYYYLYECGTQNNSNTLLLFPANQNGCKNISSAIVDPHSGTYSWSCGGSNCGFNQVSGCSANNSANITETQHAHPLDVCVGSSSTRFINATANSTGTNITTAASYIYECCQDGMTIQQSTFEGTATCKPGTAGVKTVSRFQFTSQCKQPVNLVDGVVLPNYVQAKDVLCGNAATRTICTGVTTPPTMSPTHGPTAATTTTGQPLTTATGAATTSQPGTTSMPGNMSTTASGNATNTTAIPSSSGGAGSTPKKNKINVTLLIVGLSVGVVLLLCLGGIFYYWRRRTKPGVAVNWDAYAPLSQDQSAAHQEDAP